MTTFKIHSLSLALFISLSGHADAQLSFSDQQFGAADWTATTIVDTTLDNSATFTVNQEISGGNPDAFRRSVLNWNYLGPGVSQGILVANLKAGATYDPASQGAIVTLDASCDVVMISQVGGTPGVFYHMLVSQAGSYYIAVFGVVEAPPWTHFSRSNLVATDFGLVHGNGPAHPDFSSSGAPIQFGYANSSAGHVGSPTPISITSGIDNWTVNVVRLNHTPVADAGPDQSVAEGAPVSLHGENSFDCDSDVFSYNWVQISGPAVTLSDPTSANPTFTAPEVAGGNTGVVTTLVFQLQASDSNPPDAVCSGFTFANSVDTVEIKVTNVDNAPDANAGTDQTVDTGTVVQLHGETSSDPDGDALTLTWTQTSGPAVVLTGANSSNPTFVAPAVASGGAVLTFELLADDGFGGTDVDQVVIHVQNANDPPLCSLARPTAAELWPPTHKLVSVGITGVSDPENDPVTISITSVTQDEPTEGLDDGDLGPDAVIQGSTVLLRAERSGSGNGRVYRINFTTTDGKGGSCSGSVTVSVPHDMKPGHTSVDNGQAFGSTQ